MKQYNFNKIEIQSILLSSKSLIGIECSPLRDNLVSRGSSFFLFRKTTAAVYLGKKDNSYFKFLACFLKHYLSLLDYVVTRRMLFITTVSWTALHHGTHVSFSTLWLIYSSLTYQHSEKNYHYFLYVHVL